MTDGGQVVGADEGSPAVTARGRWGGGLVRRPRDHEGALVPATVPAASSVTRVRAGDGAPPDGVRPVGAPPARVRGRNPRRARAAARPAAGAAAGAAARAAGVPA